MACNKTDAIICNQKFDVPNAAFICKMSAVETAQPSNFSLCSEMKPWARYL